LSSATCSLQRLTVPKEALEREETSPTSLHDVIGTPAVSEYDVSSSDESASDWGERRRSLREWLCDQVEPVPAHPAYRLAIPSLLLASVLIPSRFTAPCTAILLYLIMRR
jgi:hypothetical protein